MHSSESLLCQQHCTAALQPQLHLVESLASQPLRMCRFSITEAVAYQVVQSRHLTCSACVSAQLVACIVYSLAYVSCTAQRMYRAQSVSCTAQRMHGPHSSAYVSCTAQRMHRV